MRFEQLEYLASVAETKSMTLTAERLFVSQQAVSSSLRNLKEELNIELFIRTSQGLELTPEGHAALKFAQIVLDGRKQLHRELNQLKHVDPSHSDTIRIASTSSALNALLPQIFSVRKQYNDTYNMTLELNEFDHMFDNLQSKRSNLCLVTINKFEFADRIRQRPMDGFHVDCLHEDGIVAVTNKKFLNEIDLKTFENLSNYMSFGHSNVKDYLHVSYGHIGQADYLRVPNPELSYIRVNDLAFCKELLIKEKAIIYMSLLAYKLFFSSKKFIKYDLKGDKTTIQHLAIYRNDHMVQIQPVVNLIKQELQKIS